MPLTERSGVRFLWWAGVVAFGKHLTDNVPLSTQVYKWVLGWTVKVQGVKNRGRLHFLGLRVHCVEMRLLRYESI